jgi:S1-C subfamily serine protease
MRVFLPWILLGPALLAAGVGFGVWWQSARGGDGIARWSRESARVRPGAGELGAPSLAPLVANVRSGVVGVYTVHLADAELPAGEEDIVGEQSSDSLGVSRGTGFVMNARGLILTAHHLVARPQTIVVDVPGSGELEAELVGEDPSTDLAVIRLIDPPDDLFVLQFTDSDSVRQGDMVVTLGNPLGFPLSVGFGVVSFVGRHLRQSGLVVTNDYLQFTVPANPGSSGSPVFDLHGHVVGITTRAVEGMGLSFAIPSKVVRQVLRSMERNEGRVRRAYLGISFLPVERAVARRQGIPEGRGVRITGVIPGQPADRAGVRVGDVVVSFDGRAIDDMLELHDWITWSVPGTQVELALVRDGVRREPIAVTLGELGAPPAPITH